MTIDTLRNMVPDYAKDLRLNLGTLASETTLTDQQKYGCFLTSALVSGNKVVIEAITAEAEKYLSPEAISASKSAAAIMGMNNIYYRFVHLASNEQYKTLPAKLRMNVIGNPGVDKVDFELWSLAASAINGCGMCIDAHEKVVRDAGLTVQQVQTAVRIASVIAAVSAVLESETVANKETAQAA